MLRCLCGHYFLTTPFRVLLREDVFDGNFLKHICQADPIVSIRHGVTKHLLIFLIKGVGNIAFQGQAFEECVLQGLNSCKKAIQWFSLF